MSHTTITTPKRTKARTTNQRNAAEPFPIPLHDYTLSLETLLNITGKKKNRKEIGYHHTVRFLSFVDGKLTVTTTYEKQTHTLTLFIQPQQVAIACSCGSNVATLCHHAYDYLFNAARVSGGTFTDFEKGGWLETALSHKPCFSIHYNGKHGIRAELKKGLGRIYKLENNRVTREHFQPFNALPAERAGFPSANHSQQSLCYLLMVSPRDTLAPFLLPCQGILNRERTAIKRFTNYVSGIEKGLKQLLSGEELPRIRACSEIMKKGEPLQALATIGENAGEVQKLGELFRLFQTYLPLFKGALVYTFSYYGKKYLGQKPVRTWTRPTTLLTKVVSLRFTLRHNIHGYQLTLAVLVDGKPLVGHQTLASFFVTSGNGKSLYMFASLRDAGIAYWMEDNKGLITIFDNHFPDFDREILTDIKKHYEVRETGKGKSQGQ